MRFLLLSFFLLNLNTVSAQKPACVDKFSSIVQMERQAAQTYFLEQNKTLSSANFDIKYMRSNWKIDPAIRFIGGEVTFYFIVDRPSAAITFDLSTQLTTDSVLQRGKKINFSNPTEALTIEFAPELAASKLDSITIFYHGVPVSGGLGSFITSSHAGVPVSWSLSEPYGAKDWWPCKTNLGDKIDSVDIFLIYPNQYKGASNGLLQSETALPGNKSMAHWKHRYPIASYLICFAITNYSVFTNQVQLGNTTLPMLTYCYPESLQAFQTNTPLVLDAMRIFNQYFGDYPFIREKYGHVQFGFGGGMEHQTSTFIISPDEALMAHELGHQWFGDKVTTNSWQDVWLNEGFATYLAAFYSEEKYPQTKIANRQRVVNSITSVAGGTVKVDDTTNVSRIFDYRLSYQKGSHMVNMLRFKLGDAAFFKGLKQYMLDTTIAYKFARTPDLKRNLESASGQDLTVFFKQWYEGEGFPSYNVKWSQLGSSSVQINMSQTTSVPSSVSFFEMPVPLVFKNSTQQKTVIVDFKRNGEAFVKNIGFVADTVLVDPEYWLISKNNTSQKLNLTPGTPGVDIYPVPAASGEPITIYIHDFPAEKAEIAIYNTAGQLMKRQSVGLINGTEIFTLPAQGWARGVYNVQVRVEEKKIVRRIVL